MKVVSHIIATHTACMLHVGYHNITQTMLSSLMSGRNLDITVFMFMPTSHPSIDRRLPMIFYGFTCSYLCV